MSISIIAAAPQMHAAALAQLDVHELPPHQQPPVPDPIGPVSHVTAAVMNQHMLAPQAIRSSLADMVALNPQPLPPGPPEEIGVSIRSHRFDLVGLNPQPLPPGPPPEEIGLRIRSHLLDLVALNPQPLPPVETGRVRADEYCGTVARRLPVPPTPPIGPLAETAEKMRLR